MMGGTQGKWLRLWGVVLAVIVAAGVAYRLGLRWSHCTPDQVRHYILSFGLWAPLMYTVAYAQPIVPLPASVMWMTAGLAFGLGGGLVAALIASTLRGCGQFLIAKACGREVIEGLWRGRLARWDDRIAERGFVTVLWVRIIPNVPFDLQNLSLGLSRIPLGAFVAGTFLGLIPWVLVWAYIGQSVTEFRQLWKVALGCVLVIGLWRLRHRLRYVRPAE